MRGPEIYLAGSRQHLFGGPAVFLSAGVAHNRNFPQKPDARNLAYLESAQPVRVRDAVSQLCRVLFPAKVQLVFGAQPGVSTMVLDASRRLGSTTRNRVVIFQSAFYFGKVADSTIALSRGAGEILWTAGKRPPEAASEETIERAKATSLREMRSVMLSAANLIGGIFVGGMDGVEEEWELFGQRHEDLPRFAIGSTGSAAANLARHQTAAVGDISPEYVNESRSYANLMQDLLSTMMARRPLRKRSGRSPARRK